MAIGINRKMWEKIGAATGWLPVKKTANADFPSLEQIKKNMDEFHSKAQDMFPNQPDFAVDFRKQHISIPNNVRGRINNAIHALGSYHKRIPLREIISILEKENCVLIQEDGTIWSGMVFPTGQCGETDSFGRSKNNPFTFDLAYKTPDDVRYRPCNNVLVMQACIMPSESIEVVAYVS